MKEKLFFSILIMCWGLLSAKDVLIKGTAAGAEGKYLRVYTYSDLLNYREVYITQSLIDNKSAFNLKMSVNETTLYFFKIDFLTTSIFIEPDKSYTLTFDSIKPQLYNESSNPFLTPVLINYKIDNADADDLNILINHFDSVYADFITNNAVAIMRKRCRPVFEKLVDLCDSLYKDKTNKYFRTYITYKTAVLEAALYIESRMTLYDKYLKNRTHEITHIAYMEFFNQFYDKFFTDITQRIKFVDLEASINEHKSHFALLDTLGKDSLLRNELIREIVMIKGLGELYSVPGFKKENIISMLTSLAEKSKFKAVQNMSRTSIKFLSGYPNGTRATDFTLTDRKMQKYSLAQYKGKYVYLFFWNTSCSMCMSEMLLLNDMRTKYRGNIEIIGISVDSEPLKMYYFLEKYKFDYPLLHFNYDYSLTDNYFVKSLPFFVLIDKDGHIVNCPSLKPSEDIQRQLDMIFNKK